MLRFLSLGSPYQNPVHELLSSIDNCTYLHLLQWLTTYRHPAVSTFNTYISTNTKPFLSINISFNPAYLYAVKQKVRSQGCFCLSQHVLGGAMAEEFSRQSLTSETSVRSQGSTCGAREGQKWHWHRFTY